MTAPATPGDPTALPDRLAAARHLLRRAAAPGPDGQVQGFTPADAGWDWTSFHAYELAPGDIVTRDVDDQERLVLVLEGYATVTAGENDFGTVGSRDSVFDGPPPPVILLEPGLPVEITATTRALVAIGAAPAGPVRRTALIRPEDVHVETRGSGNTERRIHHILPPGAEAGRLIAFEVYTPGGNWSSYPPHKHDTENPPVEARLEELYFYRFARPQGFGFQRVYTPDRTLDQSMAVMDRDVVVVPAGYHPFGAPAGYDAYYLNVMSGPNRAWYFTLDPDHAWLMNWTPPVLSAEPAGSGE
ncbi:MAG: 5-deoxy-glucuronate isomerase [Chloroflexota bacterium]